jgi:Tol biopolymer transport system component
MSQRRDLLEHAMDLFPAPDDALGGVIERHHRRQRNKRVGAGAVGLAIALVILAALGGAGLLRGQQPVGSPSVTPSDTVPGFPQMTPHRVETIGLDGSTMQTFPGLPADAFSPVLSPDGSTLAFVTTDGSLPRIATIGTDGSGMHVLANSLLGTSPVWSPDGSHIAFVGTKPLPWNKDVYVIDADGSNLRRITRGSSQDWYPEWSPNGEYLAFVRHPPSDDEFANSVEIWSVPAAGGEATRLTNEPGWSGEPTWSPRGDRIAYVRGHDATTRVWVMNADGSEKHTILSRSGPYFAPQWSPDGTKLAVLVFEDFNSNTIVNGSPMRGVATGSLRILDISTGRLTDLGARISSSAQRARWLPSGDGLVVDRLVDPS